MMILAGIEPERFPDLGFCYPGVDVPGHLRFSGLAIVPLLAGVRLAGFQYGERPVRRAGSDVGRT